MEIRHAEEQKSPDIAVIKGTEILEKVPKAELFRLADEFAETTFDRPKIRAQKIRMKLRDALLDPLGEYIGKFSPRALHMYHKLEDKVHPPKTVSRKRNKERERLMRNIKSENTIVVTSDGAAAGVGSIEKFKKPFPDGRDCYEVGQVIIPKKFRHNWVLSIKLMMSLWEHIRTKYPDCPIISYTKNPMIKKVLIRKHFKEYHIRQIVELLKGSDDWGKTGVEKFEKEWAEAGDSFFVFDPKEQQGS